MDEILPSEQDFVLPLGIVGPELKGKDFRIPIGFILRMAEAARAAALGWGSRRPLVDWVSEIRERNTSGDSPIVAVVRAQQIQLYSKNGGKQGVTHAKLRPFADPAVRLRTRLVEVRQRTHTLRTDLYDGKKRFATVWCVVVMIDPSRGVAVPLSPTLQDRASKIAKQDSYKGAIIPVFIPSEGDTTPTPDKTGAYRSFWCLTAKYEVGMSQIDGLGHVNQSRYTDWYDDIYYWVVKKVVDAPDANNPSDERRSRALKIAKESWPSTGLLSRVEYDRETFAGTNITIQMRWIERVRDSSFVGFLFEALRRDSENKIKINNRTMHFFDLEAAGMAKTQAKL